MPKLVGRVRWLNAMEGGCDLPMLGAAARVRTQMEKMGEDIAGSDDAVATYIKLQPRKVYNAGDFRPGAIAGILWLARMPAGQSVVDHREDGNFEIGWPVADRDLTEGPDLKKLVHDIYGPAAPDIWKRLPGSLVGGKPFRIDVAPYEEIGDALTNYYRR